MTYAYTAISKDGKTIHGILEATSKDAAVSALQHQGVRPLIVKLSDTKGGKQRWSLRKRVSLKEMVLFTRQLSTLFSAGVPLNRSLNTLELQAESPTFKKIINGVARDVQAGTALGDAFAKYPDVFSDVYISMVKAGEAGGILDDILKRLATQIEQEASMRKKIKSAMTYPVVILTITIVAFFGIMIFIIPKINKILLDLGGPNAKLPIYTRVLLSVSSFMTKFGLPIGVIAFFGIFMLIRYVRTPKGKYQLHALLLQTPIIKVIITKVAIARFSRTFASLMTAGVGVLDALEVTGGAIGNKVIQKELAEAATQVKNGKPLSEPIGNSKHFPPIVAQMLAVGEETGQIDTILVKVADFYEEEVDTFIDGLASIIEPIMIVVLGAFVGLIAASVMGPIASLSKNIGNN